MDILSDHHWLLVTLLFCNACALEALPIFLDRIVPSAYAVLISVVAVLIVGEVIPQAICIGPRQLQIAEAAGPLVKFLMYATIPVSWPIAKLLDYLLGEHKFGRFNASQFGGLIEMHSLKALKEMEHHNHDYDCESFGSDKDNMKKVVKLRQTQIEFAKGILK